MIQPVSSDGVSKTGSASQLVTNDGGEGPDVEAPAMIRAADGTYVLFYSGGCYSTDAYTVSYATSQSPTGGFTKRGNLFASGDDGLTGPGGADVALTGEYMVFHGLADGGPRRFMYTAEITVSGTSVSA